METVSARIQPEVIDNFCEILDEKKSKVIRDLLDAGKKHKAVELYAQKKVSLGLGAKLAGVTLSEFMDLLSDHNVSMNATFEDLKRSLDYARKILK